MKTLESFILESAKNRKYNGFVILKPGFLKHEEEFDKILSDNGWNIKKKDQIKLSKEQASELYKMHKDKKFYGPLVDYMSSDDCIIYGLNNQDTDNPIKDMDKLKDEIREKWGKDEMKNAMHSSDSLDNIKREMDIAFSQE